MWSEWKISESFWPGNNLHGGVIIISMVKIITNDKWPGEKCEMLGECCEPSMSSGKCQRRPPGDNHRHPLHHHHAWTDSSPLYNKIHYLDHDQTRFKTTDNFYEVFSARIRSSDSSGEESEDVRTHWSEGGHWRPNEVSVRTRVGANADIWDPKRCSSGATKHFLNCKPQYKSSPNSVLLTLISSQKFVTLIFVGC